MPQTKLQLLQEALPIKRQAGTKHKSLAELSMVLPREVINKSKSYPERESKKNKVFPNEVLVMKCYDPNFQMCKHSVFRNVPVPGLHMQLL